MFHKRIFMMFAVLLCCLASVAQDIIVCKDGTSLLGKVAEITDTEVKYHKADNPDGPLYTIKIASIMRINYENGTTDVFSQDGVAPATVLAGTTGDVKDTDLLKIHNKSAVDYNLPKKLKLTAYIGGGALIAVGATFLIIAANDKVADDKGYNSVLFVPGIALTAAGVAWIPTFYLIARHKQKKLNELSSAPLFRQEIFSGVGKSLSMGFDYMTDKVKTRSIGIGMTFKF